MNDSDLAAPAPPPPRRWAAPVARRPLAAAVRLPGSKSLTARYLVLAALASGPSRIRRALRARDTDLMAAALGALGCDVRFEGGPATWEAAVRPAALRAGRPIDVGLAGTVMRFLAPLAALADGATWFTGDPAAAARPMAPLLAALRGLGAATGLPGDNLAPPPAVQPGDAQAGRTAAQADGDGRTAAQADEAGRTAAQADGDGRTAAQADEDRAAWAAASLGGAGRQPLFWVRGPARAGGAVVVDARQSSQFVSALLLAGPRFAGGLEVGLEPQQLPSRPHVEMTVAALRDFGARADQTGEFAWRVHPGGLAGRDIGVEPDLTNAAPFLAAALVAGGTVRIPDWPRSTTQAGRLMLDYIEAFGGQVAWTEGTLAVTGTGRIRGVQLDLGAAGELAPTVAALAALAESDSQLDGIGHLRGHETDRLAALAREINALGGAAAETAGGLRISPRPLRGAELRTYGDHRLATFGAVIGLRVPGVVLDDVGVTGKTFPDFPALWAGLA